MPPADCGCSSVPQTTDCSPAPCCPRILPAIARGIHGVLNTLLPCCTCGDPCQPCRPQPRCRMSYQPCRCLPLIPIISYRYGSDCAPGCAPGCGSDYMNMTRSRIGEPTPAQTDSWDTEQLPPDLPGTATPPEDTTPPQTRPVLNPQRAAQAWHTRTTSMPRHVSTLPLASARPVHREFANKTVSHLTPVTRSLHTTELEAPQRFQPVAARELPKSQVSIQPTTQRTAHGNSIPDNPLR